MSFTPTDGRIAFAGRPSRAEFDRIMTLMLPPWARWYVLYPVVGAIFLAVSVAGARRTSELVVDGAFALVVTLAVHLFEKRRRTRAWMQMVRLTGRIHGVVSADGIEWNTDNSTSRFEWAKIVRVARGANLAVVFFAPRSGFYFPRSFFESDAAWAALDAELVARVPA